MKNENVIEVEFEDANSKDNVINQMFDEMLEESAKQCAKEQAEGVTEEEKTKAKKTTKETLEGFLKYIRSSNFETKVNNVSKQYNIPKKLVKNNFIAGILGKIADILHLTIAITAEIVKRAIEFISAIINKLVDFSYNVCIKITNLFTLNCGSMA